MSHTEATPCTHPTHVFPAELLFFLTTGKRQLPEASDCRVKAEELSFSFAADSFVKCEHTHRGQLRRGSQTWQLWTPLEGAVGFPLFSVGLRECSRSYPPQSMLTSKWTIPGAHSGPGACLSARPAGLYLWQGAPTSLDRSAGGEVVPRRGIWRWLLTCQELSACPPVGEVTVLVLTSPSR